MYVYVIHVTYLFSYILGSSGNKSLWNVRKLNYCEREGRDDGEQMKRGLERLRKENTGSFN